MKISEQASINEDVNGVYHDLMHSIDYHGGTRLAKLRNCKAEVYVTDGYTYLKSYNTIVAAIGHEDDICYDFLRMVYGYTATSAQHITKFMRDYHSDTKKTYYPI